MKIENVILYKSNKHYIDDVFKNFYHVKYKLICERFRISQSDCDEIEQIFIKNKNK